MSERELRRIEVLSKVIERRMTGVAAASLLDVSVRQVQRLSKTFQADGATALRHKARGRHSNNRIVDGVRDFVLELIREHYIDFGPMLAREKLLEWHQIAVSTETLRKWMTEAGTGHRAGSARGSFTSHGAGATASASWCRSMARTIGRQEGCCLRLSRRPP